MITNDRQYRITRSQLKKLRAAIDAFDLEAVARRLGSHELGEIQLAALRSEEEVLGSQVQEYEALASGTVHVLKGSTLEELPVLLIKARIAKGLNQRQLAERLGVKEQQIQRYESDTYRTANMARLAEVAAALDLNVSEIAEPKTVGTPQPDVSEEGIPWDMFPVDEMYRRGWFEDFSGSLVAARANAGPLLRQFVGEAVAEPVPAMLRSRTRMGGKLNPYALLAWQCRVLALAKKMEPARKFRRASIDEDWLRGLVRKSASPDGPVQAKEYLEKAGILLVVEPHLTHTHLDGAALLLPDGRPVVGLTLRYDRLDNFWFVLMHELIHVKEHLRKGRVEDIFDDLDAEPDALEKEADAQAGDMLIADEGWETALARYIQSEDMVLDLAKQLKISPAIIAGRIRKEAGNYIILKNLVGQGEVRKAFGEVQFG